MRASYKPTLRWILAAWIGCLIVISLQPIRLGVTRGGTLTHVVLHLLAFGVPAVLLQLSTRRNCTWYVVLGALCLAAGIESAQALIYKNPFEWHDLFADCLGALIALLPNLQTGEASGSDSA